MALGDLGLGFEYFYSLTPRVFNNILKGYVRQKNRSEELFMWGVRKICHYSLLPYKKKGLSVKEQDVFLLPSEKEQEDLKETDLEKIVKQVEKDREFWNKVDKNKKDGCSTG